MAQNNGDIRYVGVKETVAYGIANAGQCFGYNIIAGSYLSLFFVMVFGASSTLGKISLTVPSSL